MKPLAVIAAAVVLLLHASGCVTSPSPTSTSGRWCGSGGSYGTMSATIDGTVWTASRMAVPFSAMGSLEVNGSDCAYFLGFVVNGVNGPGTYPVFAVNYLPDPFTAGPTWSVTSVGGGSGTVTVTALTSTTVSGSFAFSLVPDQGASGTKVITNGSFQAFF